MTHGNDPNSQQAGIDQQPTTSPEPAEQGTAEPGTAVPPAVDPDDTVVRDDTVEPDEAGELLGADTPGRATTTEKDPSEWVTGDEPMTGAQRSYLDTLARQAGERVPADLTKAEASEHIDRLQRKTGRGADST